MYRDKSSIFVPCLDHVQCTSCTTPSWHHELHIHIYNNHHDYNTRAHYHSHILLLGHEVQVVFYASHHVMSPKVWPMRYAWSIQSIA